LATADKIGKAYDVQTDPEIARQPGNNSKGYCKGSLKLSEGVQKLAGESEV
jgi:hypothetical protein